MIIKICRKKAKSQIKLVSYKKKQKFGREKKIKNSSKHLHQK